MTSLLLLKSMLFASSLQSRKKKKKSKIVPAVNPDSTNGMCRICNQEQGQISIFHNFMQPDLPDEIKNFSGITLSESDDLPKHMCQSCLDLLNGCIIFRELCQKTNKKLIELSIKKEYDKIHQNYNIHDTKKVKINNGDESDDSYNIPSPTTCIDEAPGWACSACCKEFPDMGSYNNHLPKCKINVPDEEDQKVEGTKKKYLCDTCGKTAYSHASLLIHMGIHENKFPFKCEECPYQGRTKDLLKVHKRSHLVDKPFKCTQCPKATTTASNLAKHMRHVHSTVRPFTCNYCEKAFSYQHDMKRHIKDTHLRQGTVECEVCHKKFNTRKILQGHRWKIHKIKGERQGRLPSYLQCQIEDDMNESNEKYLT